MDSLTTLQHQSGLPNGLLYDDQNDQDPEPPTDVHEVEVTHPIDSALAIQGLRITTDTLKEDSGPITHSTRGPSLPTSQDHNSDAASVHSMPAVLVSSPTSLTVDRPSTASSVTPSQHLQRAPLPAPARTHTLPDDSSITQQQRRVRHRSAIEVIIVALFTHICSLTFGHRRFVHQAGYRVSLQILYTDGIIYPVVHHRLSKNIALPLQMLNQTLTFLPVPRPLCLGGLSRLLLLYPLPVSKNLD